MDKRTAISSLFAILLLIANMVRVNADDLDGADFRLHNETHLKLVAVFVVPTNVDISDFNDLKPYAVTDNDGDWTSVDPLSWIKVIMHGDACYYTIAAAFADGSYAVRRNVELCNITDFRFHE